MGKTTTTTIICTGSGRDPVQVVGTGLDKGKLLSKLYGDAVVLYRLTSGDTIVHHMLSL